MDSSHSDRYLASQDCALFRTETLPVIHARGWVPRSVAVAAEAAARRWGGQQASPEAQEGSLPVSNGTNGLTS